MRDIANDSNIVHGEVRPLLLSSAPERDGDGTAIDDDSNERTRYDDDFGGIVSDVRGGYRSSVRLFEAVLEFSRRPSVRSERRRWMNIILGILLMITSSLLIGSVGYSYYKRVYLPRFREEQLRELIRRHAADARERAKKCANVDWETACIRLSGASARRRSLYTGNADRSSEIFDDAEGRLLDSDDPSITYDNHCLLTYRMRLFGNITFPYHASSRLDSGGKYTMALLIQHGAMRNSEEYFCSFKRLMQNQEYRDFRDILIIAPDFNYEQDDLVHPNDVFWNTSKPWGDWRVGAESDPNCCGNKGHTGGAPRTFSSYEVLDHILAKLTNRRLFPNMNKISYVGHSAGGQMVQRYAVISTLAALWDLQSDIDIKFIIANPSSYAYLTPQRYHYSCGNCTCTPGGCACDGECTVPRKRTLSTPRRESAGTNFPCYAWNYNRWPYGIGSFSDESTGHYIPYALRDGMLGVERALRFYNKLHVVYMVGQNDTCNDGLPTCDDSCWKRENYEENEHACWRNDMDTRCPAMLQGPCRRTRGYQYMEYLRTLYGEPTHHLFTVPGVGHNASGMFSSDIGTRELFDFSHTT